MSARAASDRPSGMWALVWHRPVARVCLVVLALYLIVGLLGLAGVLPSPKAVIGDAQQPPALDSPALWMGTDRLGRSVFWRVLAGTQTALLVGLGTVLVAVPLGTLLGLLAGWFGGWVDALVDWLYAVVTAVPGLLLVVAVAYAMGRGLGAICIALAVSEWAGVMRLVRAEVLKQRSLEYVLAARVGGASPAQQLLGELAPNVLHIPIVWASLLMLSAIKAEVVLTYLGLGIQDGASWGLLIAGAAQDLVNDVWWPLAGAVLAMFGLTYSLSRLADEVQEAMNPHRAA
jgi:ABC-type dipeptide/oligopeptide/nickel transport system permease subunit